LLQHLNFAQIFIELLVLLFSLAVHESAHAWTAWRLGDSSGRRLGRISLNPAVHVDPVGTILFPLLAVVTKLPIIGWAKPVPVDILKLKNYRRDFALIAAAGPVANLALAVIAAVAMRLATVVPARVGRWDISGPLALSLVTLLGLNVLLAVFNLIPVPPLDGGNVLAGLLPDRVARVLDYLRPYGFVVLYVLILSGLFGPLILAPSFKLQMWLVMLSGRL